MSFDFIKPSLVELKPRISVIGVGGAGGNAVANMLNDGLQGVDFVVRRIDQQGVDALIEPLCIERDTLTYGLGQHLLHLDPLDLGVGLVLPGIGQDRVMGGAGLRVALDADDHAAGIGLVQDVGGHDLHDDGIAHAAGEPGGLIGRFG